MIALGGVILAITILTVMALLEIRRQKKGCEKKSSSSQ